MSARLAGRAAAYGLGVGLATLLAIGLPTVLVPNPWFARMTPVRPQDYAFLAATVLLAGLLGATYALPATCSLQQGKLTAGGVLALLAVGCPVCNKVVLLLVGASGALTLFQPVQPLLGLGGLALLAAGLALRLQNLRSALAARSKQGPGASAGVR